jgi:hypothetical protein
VNDLAFHLILFAVIGVAIVAASAVYSELDDVKALKTVPRRLLVFFAGCGILTAILLVIEHTFARVS